jgi:hypothetical protein
VETLETPILAGFQKETGGKMCASVRQATHLHAVRRYATLRPSKQKSAASRRLSFLFTGDPQVFPQASCVLRGNNPDQKGEEEAR